MLKFFASERFSHPKGEQRSIATEFGFLDVPYKQQDPVAGILGRARVLADYWVVVTVLGLPSVTADAAGASTPLAPMLYTETLLEPKFAT